MHTRNTFYVVQNRDGRFIRHIGDVALGYTEDLQEAKRFGSKQEATCAMKDGSRKVRVEMECTLLDVSETTDFTDTVLLNECLEVHHTALGTGPEGQPVDEFTQVLCGDDEYRYTVQGLDGVTAGCSLADAKQLTELLKRSMHHALIGLGFTQVIDPGDPA